MEQIKEDLYKKMYLVRAAEQQIIAHYFEDEMKTPMHMSMGEEAIVAGVVQAIQPDGQAVGTFRSHALYLSMTGDTDAFFQELYGKKSGIANGKSGSMHLSCPEKGYMGSSAIVSSAIPVACGLAFANQYHKRRNVAAAFFGDGATEEGVFWESLNLACVLKLPMLFVCEDNGLAVHAHPETRRGYRSLTEILSHFDCAVYDTNGSTDAYQIYTLAKEASERIFAENRPAVLYATYYRYLEHVGVSSDFQAGYRSKSEFDQWNEKDPLTVMRRQLDLRHAEEIEAEIDADVRKSLENAQVAEFPAAEELMKGVMAE